ncbi:MAG: DUF5615 family PIN-like protein [Deltaproteobacteria bacterium]|nr:DUF5615 family PIN-like protein [Deltaproteobacteria bacterium]
MNLLLDMNLSRDLGIRLEQHGHRCRHVAAIGMARAGDAEIMAEAVRSGEVVLTHDVDYGRLLAFSGAVRPSVVVFRLRALSHADLAVRLLRAWPEVAEPLQRGAVVVIEEGGIRIRLLPIGEHGGGP